jgi:hypothetical protein
MPRISRRPFTLSDAMVLIAATAFGLGGLRLSTGGLGELGAQLNESLGAIAHPEAGWSAWGWSIHQTYAMMARVTLPFAWVWTLSLLWLRLQEPRPGWRQLGRQPGAVASLAATVVLIPSLIGLAVMILVEWFSVQATPATRTTWEIASVAAFLLIPGLIGSAVLGAWTTLILGRRFRAEPSWIDRAGRCLGAYWIAVILLPFWGLA